MAKIVIEIFSTHKQQGEYKSFASKELHLGRALNNDIIVNDPYVSANHILITSDGDQLKIQDLDSENGTFVTKGKQRVKELTIQSGEEILIGRTRLRIYLDSHQPQPTRTFATGGKIFDLLKKPVVAWGLLIFLMGVAYIQAHMLTVKDESFFKLMAASIITSTIILVWAGFWALIGRLICHQVYFCIHISICSIWFIVDYALGLGNDYLSYYLNNQLFYIITEYLVFIGPFICTLIVSLTFATHMTQRARITFSTVFSILLIISITGIKLSFTEDSDLKYFFEESPYDIRIKPPLFGKPRPKGIGQFIAMSDQIFVDLKDDYDKEHKNPD